jgi:Arm DNA-binding domain
MRLNKLSAGKVAALNEPGLYGDGGGLWLQVTPAADGGVTKQWVARYMIAGRARKMGLGSLATFSLAEVRERARQVRQQVADGIDPIEARLAARDALRKEEAARKSLALTLFLDPPQFGHLPRRADRRQPRGMVQKKARHP